MPAPTPAMELPQVNGHNLNIKDGTFQSDMVEPIAIIGLSITLPQSMTTLDLLWENLARRKSAMTEFPKRRLNLDAFYDPDTARVNGVWFSSEVSSPARMTNDKSSSRFVVHIS